MSAAAGDAAASTDGGGTAAAAAPESVRVLEPSSGALNLSVALRDVADLGLQATLRGFDKDDSGTVDLVEGDLCETCRRIPQVFGNIEVGEALVVLPRH